MYKITYNLCQKNIWIYKINKLIIKKIKMIIDKIIFIIANSLIYSNLINIKNRFEVKIKLKLNLINLVLKKTSL